MLTEKYRIFALNTDYDNNAFSDVTVQIRRKLLWHWQWPLVMCGSSNFQSMDPNRRSASALRRSTAVL